MKKQISCTIILITVLIISGCQKQNTSSQPTNNNESSNEQNTDTTSKKEAIDELGIKLTFVDGYKLIQDEEKNQYFVLFGPIEKELSPIPNPPSSHIYRLDSIQKRSTNEIISAAKNGAGPMSFEPSVININDLEIVKWVEAGHCENRTMEVVGPTKNYIFSSLGCHKDQKFDFDYFERTIETIEFLK